MKKIINGKVYNTDTAQFIGEWENNYNTGDFRYCREVLYKTKKGNYFVYGEGGPMSKYSKSCGNNSSTGSEDIELITPDEARMWAHHYMDADVVIQFFGEVEEG